MSGRGFAREVGADVSRDWNPSQATLDLTRKEHGWPDDLSQEEIVGNIFSQWTSSSGDPLSRMVMSGGLKEAGLSTENLTLPMTWLKDHPGYLKDYEDMGRVIYNKTQSYFEQRGIEGVHLFRRASSTGERVYSSWSSSYGAFVTSDANLLFIEKDIPVRFIFSIPETGFGNIIEDEVVVFHR